MKKTAIIIGAGPAGLTAAYYLLKKTDIKPIVLEESEYIGGISRTAEYKGNRIDLGGHRFFSKIDEVNKLWMDILPLQGAPALDDELLNIEKPLSEGGPNPKNEERVMLVRNRVSRIFFLRKFFDYPISLKLETIKNMGFARTCKAGFGYIKSCLFKRKENSLEDFYINRFGEPLYDMFFKDYTTKLWGRAPSQISPEWGAQRVKGLSLLKILWNILSKPFRPAKDIETSLIEQFYYPKKGPGQLWEALAEDIRALGGEIILNSRVDRIRLDNGSITSVGVGTEEYVGDIVMSSMPIKDLIKAMGDVPTEEVRKIAEGLPYRDFMTVGLLCDKLKLENKTKHKTLSNIVPDCWIYVQERDAVIGRLQIFNNWSPYMVAEPQKDVWIGLEYFCEEGDEYWSMNDEEFIGFAVDELVRLDIIDRDAVKDSLRIKVKKAYPAYFDTYSQFDDVKNYLNNIENLWCIGRNGQHRYNNMDHSMMTAIEAVNAIAEGSSSKDAVWNVNTESEYHEEKGTDKKAARCKSEQAHEIIVSMLLIAAALFAVGYFILFPSKGYYSSDCFDSLYWANASYESGQVFSRDFTYSALLPFSAQLWWVPLIAVCGMTMNTQIIGMAIFALLFAASIVFMCRSLKWRLSWCAITVFLTTLLLSASEKLREIMWCHVIYYSLGLLLLFLFIGIAARLCEYTLEDMQASTKRFTVYASLLLLLAMGSATDGFHVLAISLVPVLGAVCVELLSSKKGLLSKENAGSLCFIGVSAIGVVAGFLILDLMRGGVTAGYASAFSNYSDVYTWTGNAQKFFNQYLTLIGIDIYAGMPLVGVGSFINLIRLAAGLLVLVIPFIGLLSFGSKGDKKTRLVITAHFINSFVIMFVFICGSLSDANWRLVPMLGSAIAASVATVRWLAASFKPIGVRFAALALALLLICSALPARDMLTMESDYGKDNEYYSLARELKAHELTCGYASFWNAGTVTMASDSYSKLRNVEIRDGMLVPYYYQSMNYWFEPQEGQREYFVALTYDEYYEIYGTEYWRNLVTESYMYEFESGMYHVTVFDENIFDINSLF